MSGDDGPVSLSDDVVATEEKNGNYDLKAIPRICRFQSVTPTETAGAKPALPVTNGLNCGKLVSVSSSGKNVAYVGTWIKGVKGKDCVSQKVLLTPVNKLPALGKAMGMARFILPRPETTTATTTAAVTTTTTTTPSPQCVLLTSPVSTAVTTQVNGSAPFVAFKPLGFSATLTPSNLNKTMISISPTGAKLLTPNIIRQKIMTDPKTVTVKSIGILQSKPQDKETSAKAMSDDVLHSETNEKEESLKEELEPTVDTHLVESDSILIEDSDSANGSQTVIEEPKTEVTVNGYEVVREVLAENPKKEEKPEEVKDQTVVRARKRKTNVTATTEPPLKIFAQQQENLKIMPGAEERDPLKVIKWGTTGLGVLPGSDIKMTINEYGMLEVHDETLSEHGVPELSEDKNKKIERDPTEIYCCISCSVYGLLTEFFNENYCSVACRDNIIAQQQAIFKKIEDEGPSKKTPSISSSSTLSTESEVKRKRRRLSKCEPTGNDIETEVKPKPVESEVIEIDEDTASSDSDSVTSKSQKKSKVDVKKVKKLFRKVRINKKAAEEVVKMGRLVVKSERIQKNDDQPRQMPKCVVTQDLDPGNSLKLNEKVNVSPSSFPWVDYLARTQSKGAWIKCFNQPYPIAPHGFKAGHKLEAIDPEHQSTFSVATVAEVRGYRIKIHFDGYPKMYDFWVNADSPNIFACGFCQRHKINLHPPLGHKRKEFQWLNYNAKCQSTGAPSECFSTSRRSINGINPFRIGMRLEAVDRKNTFLVCVASVAGVIDNRILVHFDSWGNMYDYWVDITSPYIHPVGWCRENNHELTPPNGYDPRKFSWDEYLKSTQSVAAPARGFCLRPPVQFKRGSKLEAVDKRAPHLLRVATIADILPYQIKLTFDGFPDHFGYWTDDDSPDIHPLGWAMKTGHPLEPPPHVPWRNPVPVSLCKTPCCLGEGHYRGLTSTTHNNVKDCPYSPDHLNDEFDLSNRIGQRQTEDIINLDGSESDEEGNEHKWKWIDVRRSDTASRPRIADPKMAKQSNSKSTRQSSPDSVPSSSTSICKEDSEDLAQIRSMVSADVIVHRVPSDQWTNKRPSLDPIFWPLRSVSNFMSDIVSNPRIFEEKEIDGEALFMLSPTELTNDLKLSTDEATAVLTAIGKLRKQVKFPQFPW